jgi:hypothetical protein
MNALQMRGTSIVETDLNNPYNDIFLRANFQDTGVIPRGGLMYCSPDIIPYGSKPVDPKIFKDDWNKDFGMNVQSNMPNYIWVRAQNLKSGPAKGNAYLYWSKASLILLPHLWKKNQISVSEKELSVPLSAATQFENIVGAKPFNWKPETISGDHYCLIARVETNDHPNPIPKSGDFDSFAKFVSENPGFGWRNVNVVDSGADESVTTYYEHDNQDRKMYFFLECTGFPGGAEVGFSCPDASIKPPLDFVHTIKGETPTELLGCVATVPANFKGDITYWYKLKGMAPKPGFEINLHVTYEIPKGHELYKYAFNPMRINAPIKFLGDLKPTALFALGAHTTKIKSTR